MPTYEYRCLKCKKKFDRPQSMSEAPLKKCIFCKGRAERLISAGAGLIFKGTGFYQTDYKKSKPQDTTPKTETKKETKEAPSPPKSTQPESKK